MTIDAEIGQEILNYHVDFGLNVLMCHTSGEVRYYFCFNEMSQFGMNLFYHAFFDQNNKNFRPVHWFVTYAIFAQIDNSVRKKFFSCFFKSVQHWRLNI